MDKRRTRIGKLALACVLVNTTAVFAVPITCQFTASGLGPAYSASTGTPFLEVPAPFADFDWTWQAPISGSITLESGVTGLQAFTDLNGVRTEVGLAYINPVTQLTLDIRDQHFEFARTLPPNAAGPGESSILVVDLPLTGDLPPGRRDTYNLNVQMGTGVLDDPFSHLAVSFRMNASPEDFGVIASRDMVENLRFSPGWLMSFSFLDPVTRSGYSLRGDVTSIELVSVPEPASLSLFAAGIALMFAVRRRRAPRACRHHAVITPA